MSYYTAIVNLTDGTNVTISAVSPTNIGSSFPTVHAYNQGTTGVSTVFDATDFYNQALRKESITSATLYDFIQYRNDAALSDASYIAEKNYIVNNTVWLYGSLELGGLAFFKDWNNQIRPLACYGFRQNALGYKRYEVVYTTDLSATEVQSIALMFEGSDLSDNYSPKLAIMYFSDETAAGQDALTYFTWEWLQEGWVSHNALFLDQAIDNCNWFSILTNDYPEKSWYMLNGSEWRKSLYTTLAYNDVLYGNILGDSEVKPEYNPSLRGGTTSKEGGEGDYPDRSDEVDFPDLDDIDDDAINSGFVTLYNPTKAQIESYNNFLWTGITDSIANQIKKLIANPLDGVLFIAQCHFHPNTTGLGDVIRFCGISSGVSANLIAKQHQEIDCGSLTIDNDTEMFLDFAPYSKASIYLPYIGIKPLDINDLHGAGNVKATITVKYQVDLLSGGGVAKVKITRSKRCTGDAEVNDILYEFPCNVYQQFPLSATDWRAAVNNMISLISGAAAVATGNGAGLGAMASAVASQQVSVIESGNISAAYGYFGTQKPYLILERPIQAIPTNFGSYQGWVSNIFVNSLREATGYCEVQQDTLWTDGVNCTDAEMEEIKQLLYSGVWLDWGGVEQ